MIEIGDGQKIAASVSFQCKKLKIGKNAVIHDRVTFLGEEIEIGDNVWIGQDAIIDGSEKIKIGNNVIIGFGAYLLSHTGNTSIRKDGSGVMLKKAAIVIEDGAWVMSRASINPGVKIGKNARVYNGAIVTKDVPANAVAKGVPAVIKK
ncbi:sugar O-acetyltransferase [Candidatus Micrarchaeota archaeon]|nr:sugar O-acetyltransferase [Candidatus Micrarchaeota archaeon]